MGRVVVAIDRVISLVVGAALIALGLGAILWQLDRLSWASRTLTAPWLVNATEQPWWPWATGGAGVVLVLLGLWWLLSHLPRRRLGEIRLPGSGPEGILRLNTDAIASAAGKSLGATDGVRSASGRALVDRGRPTIVLTATVDPMTDLQQVTAAAERVQEEVDQAVDGAPVATRFDLQVASS